MKKLKLFMILVTLCVLLTSQFNLASAKGKGKKSDWLKYLDADILLFIKLKYALFFKLNDIIPV